MPGREIAVAVSDHGRGWCPCSAGCPGCRRSGPTGVEWLAKDVVAGVVLTTLLVPQGMAYAELAGLPPITGLYTSIMCLLGYAVFGPSRILVLGPDSSLGPMIAATILPLMAAGGDPERAVALASMLAIMVAAIMIVAAVAKLGFIADLISKPTMIGYMNGLALTILVGQLPKLFGFKVERRRPDRRAHRLRQGAGQRRGGRRRGRGRDRRDRADPGAAAVAAEGPGGADHGGGSRSPRRRSSTWPTTVSAWSGCCPRGSRRSPSRTSRLSDLGPLFAGALGIALVSLADTISTASAFAARTGQEVRGNGEMIGIGAANLAAGLFQGFPVSTSGSRTAVAERSGAKTQLTGVTGAVLIILMIVLVPGLFRNLPQPALAAVVITASLSLADIPGTVRLWRQRKAEFLLSIAAFLGVALLGVLPGIAIAVGLSILNVFRRAWWPYDTELGRVDGLEGYHDVHSYPEAEHLPGLVIYRFDAPLFFANAKTFRDEVTAAGQGRPDARLDRDRRRADDRRGHHRLRRAGRTRRGAERRRASAWSSPSSRTRYGRKIERYGLTRTIDPRHFFPTIEAAVAAFRQQTGAHWAPAAQAAYGRTAPGHTAADTGRGQPHDRPASPPVG